MAKVLIVDDEASILHLLGDALRPQGHQVLAFRNGRDAMEVLEPERPDVVIVDLNLERSRTQGLEILQKARVLQPAPVVIVITGFGSVQTAVDAMKLGAYDYLEKPFDMIEFSHCVQRALSFNKAVSENQYLRGQLRDRYQVGRMIGKSAPMQEVFRIVQRVANTDSTVLILGESGTGKELVARALHFTSRRQFAPFIPVNCGGLPENLLESELFGHRKGAFTGAIYDRRGLFQEADGGTIFLDEIGSMPLALQSHLLRVLQEREIKRVGDNTTVPVNVRVVAATNVPLEKHVKSGFFREDLYYRLNVITIPVAPLRDRRDDIPLLVAHLFRSRFNHDLGKDFRISKTALNALCSFDWPGNVRELENVLERASALCDCDCIRAIDLPPALRSDVKISDSLEEAPADTINSHDSNEDQSPLKFTNGNHANGLEPLKEFLHEQEVAYLNRALLCAKGDKEQAARLLGISLATFYRKLGGEEGSS
jgi:two-component system, NtrC family, response regulator AtoC